MIGGCAFNSSFQESALSPEPSYAIEVGEQLHLEWLDPGKRSCSHLSHVQRYTV